MDKNKDREREPRTQRLPMNTPPVVSAQEWEAARQQLLVSAGGTMRIDSTWLKDQAL
jgi:predicted dithiol-disulfide oxidoreductase (DUF899 family)